MQAEGSDRVPVENAVLTGCSAGGIGTILNCDWFAEQFQGAKVACRPEAGWFGLEQATYDHFVSKTPDPDPRKLTSSNWTVNVQPYGVGTPGTAFSRCADDYNAGKLRIDHCEGQQLGPVWCCSSPPLIYQYSKTPMFVSENTADAYQVFSSGGCPQEASSCKKSLNNKKLIAFWDYIRSTISSSLTYHVVNGPKSSQDGLFAPACLQHCMPQWQVQNHFIIHEVTY